VATLRNNYNVSNADEGYIIGPLYTGAGQSFKSTGFSLTKVVFSMSKFASPTGNAYAKVYAHSGTFGSSSVPTGSALATSDAVDVSGFSTWTDTDLIDFDFSGDDQIELSNNTDYVVTIEYADGDIINKILVEMDDSSPTYNGNASVQLSGSWVEKDGADLCFYLYGDDLASTDTDSERGLYLQGSVDSNSERGLYIAGKDTSTSERGLYISGGGVLNSERGLYLSGKVAESLERGLYLQGEITIDSERGLYLEGYVSDLFTRESASDLESDDTNLTTVFSEQEYTDVGTDDDDFVDLEGNGVYQKFLFKAYNDNSNNTDNFVITWKGKTTLAPSDSSVYLQIYNRDTPSWETIDTESSANANTEFTLSGIKTTSLSDYYDEDYVVNCRVYQGGA